jgi:class 3 adenylate cyclase/tetratricopeptide (TPR) repeat protein
MTERRRERKVVTVLFADLVGFTAQAETLDPEDVEAFLRPYHERLRSELERFGGTVEKFIGDAVVAAFGAPQAHEDDPERAVRAALEIRDWARDDESLELRIAVNTGEALVTLGARPEQGEGMVAGDVVNTAARLQAAAPTNGILVGETTYRATRHVIEYQEARPVAAKGKAEPVAVWKAVKARARFGVDVRQHGAAPLVGRERELDVLSSALARARGAREPQLVTLVGGPGIGKSRLVWELFELADADPELITWRQGRSLPYGEGISFWALGEMVKAEAGILESDAADAAAEKLAHTVAARVPPAEVEWIQEQLRPLVGLGASAEAADTRDQAFAAWRVFLESIAESGPLVLAFDDLHWADDGLLDFVDHLADWASGVPLLMVCSARPELLEHRPGWGGGKLNATMLSVGPLDDEDSARLIAGLVDRTLLPAELQAALLERAGGNPLYAEQFALLFRELGAVDDAPLPETVQGIIAARLDGLPPGEKALLQDAAVVGKVFWSGALGALAGGDAPEASSLHALERKGFVRRERRSSVEGDEEYAFRHVLVRDVAYGQIPRAERAEKHRIVAEWIESLGRPEDRAEMVAHHYSAALDLTRAAGQDGGRLVEPARRSLRDAGDRALRLNAFESAAGFYAGALELARDDGAERAELLLQHGISLFHAREEGESELVAASDALLAVGDVEGAAEAQTILVELAWKRLDQPLATERLERAREYVEDLPPSRVKAFVLSNVCRFLMLAGRNEEAIAVGTEALDMTEQLGLDALRANTLASVGPARVQLGDLQGVQDLEDAIPLAGNSPDALRVYSNLGAMVAQTGDLRRAERIYEEALSLSRRLGHGPSVRWVTGVQAENGFWVGRWDLLERVAGEYETAGEAGEPHYLLPTLLELRGHIRLARGDLDGALRDSDRALTLARSARDPQVLGPVLGSHVIVLFDAGRRDEASACLDEYLSHHAGWLYGLRAPSLWAGVQLGRRDDMVRAFDKVRSELPWFEAQAAFLANEFERAAEIYGRAGSAGDEAFTRLRLAEQLAQQGRRAEADEQLQRALAFYRSVGATRYIREGEQLFAASA